MGQVHYEAVQPGDFDVVELLAFYDQQRHATTQSMEKLRGMLDRSFCIVTARMDEQLIGLARGVTDGVRGYLTECKLDPRYQGPAAVTRVDGRIEHDDRGIARELAVRVLDAFRDFGVERIEVTAYGTEEDFCRDLGFRPLHGAVTMQLDPKVTASVTV